MPRYFLMRCAEAQVVRKASQRGVWPVSYSVVDRLNEAFAAAAGEPVILIFSVSGSNAFQGAARMLEPVSKDGLEAWGGSMPACRVEWLRRAELRYAEAEHLINPLSDPPQPVRAGKDGTEIEGGVARQLLALLERAPPAHEAGAGDGRSPALPRPSGAPPGALPGAGVPGMVGGALMGMPEGPFMVGGMGGMAGMAGLNPLLLGMVNPMAAAMGGMMNPMAAAMLLGGMPGMLPGMRPGMLPGAAPPPLGTAGVKPEAPEPEPLPGLPPGFDAGGRLRERDEREWRAEREQFRDGPRGGYRDGPPFRDGPPLGFRDGPPFRDGPQRGGDWAHGRGPPGFERGLPPHRDFERGGPPPWEGPPREDRGNVMRCSYEEYVERFNRIRQQLGGGEGKENGAANCAAAVPGAPAAGGAAANLAAMSEDDYVMYCQRLSAQVGMPFDEGMVRQHYRTARAALESGGAAPAAPAGDAPAAAAATPPAAGAAAPAGAAAVAPAVGAVVPAGAGVKPEPSG